MQTYPVRIRKEFPGQAGGCDVLFFNEEEMFNTFQDHIQNAQAQYPENWSSALYDLRMAEAIADVLDPFRIKGLHKQVEALKAPLTTLLKAAQKAGCFS